MPLTPFVTVIIPTHNRAALVERAIRSVLNQNFDDIELIVIDDYSTDDTRSIIDSIVDPRLIYIRHQMNRGVSAARNTGIREARGQWIAYLDSDDWWCPEKLTVQMKLITESTEPNLGFVTCGIEIREPNNVRTLIPRPRNGAFATVLRHGMKFTGPTSSLIVRHFPGRPIAWFDEDFRTGEDWDYLLRIAAEYEMAFTSNCLAVLDRSHLAPRLTSVGTPTTSMIVVRNLEHLLVNSDLVARISTKNLAAIYARLASGRLGTGDHAGAMDALKVSLDYYPMSVNARLLRYAGLLGRRRHRKNRQSHQRAKIK